MMGDGTNDVGGLKEAAVGIAVINPPVNTDVTLSQTHLPNLTQTSAATGEVAALLDATALLHEATEGAREGAYRRGMPLKAGRGSSGSQWEQRLHEVQEAAADSDGGVLVKPGDASFASPFTSRGASISAALKVLQQGRATLVTTIQMFKILALNCLVSAYGLSVLYLEGIKNGDSQMTLGAVLNAAAFLFISRAKPMPTLSARRPPTSVLSAYAAVSVGGQFICHLMALSALVHEAWAHEAPERERDPEGKFEPGVLNTVVFLVLYLSQVTTFAVNYTGPPFMESLRANTPMFALLVLMCALGLALATGALPFLADWLELVALPQTLRESLVSTALVTGGACYAVELVAQRLI
mmetsp:Transcript_28312/g.66398  ORF Transcript_28312/g.66398 Transcript_28312/m.66398 type:complete len:354 (+) Transcript_28312:470-1531(+)